MSTTNSKRVAFLAAIVVIGIAIWWAFEQRKRPAEESVSTTVNVEDSPPDNQTQAPVASTIASGNFSNANDASVESKATRNPELLNQIVGAKNVPINFYGKVLDQDDQPIVGVKIRMSVRQWSIQSPVNVDAGFSERSLTSDLNGQFQLTGENGDSVSIKAIEKEGFELSGKSKLGFGYTGSQFFSPDPNNPVIYRMWKKSGAERLIFSNKFFGIVPDGRTYTIDLLAGTKTEAANAEGDFRVSVTRPIGVSRRDRYDWSFTIEPIAGGIQESDDEFMYRAPEAGYVSNLAIQFEKSDPKWSRVVKKRFLIKTRREMYGRVEVEIFGFYDGEAALSVKSAVNPSGSRNLEYDEAVQPKPTVHE